MSDKISSYLDWFKTVSLDEIEGTKLMNRIDVKYIISLEHAEGIFRELTEDYSVLEIESQKSGQYQTVYYDTHDLKMFHAHVTGRFPRFKIRERSYSQNGIHFLEVKHKALNGRTSKKRLMINKNDFRDKANRELIDKTPFRMEELYPTLKNRFNRVTLINKERTERLTFDFNLVFKSSGGTETPVYENAVVMELKQNKQRESIIGKRMKNSNIRQCGMSKYCIGMLLLHRELSFKMYKKNFTKFINTIQ